MADPVLQRPMFGGQMPPMQSRPCRAASVWTNGRGYGRYVI